MRTIMDARNALLRAWPAIVDECRAVLGSELHYQAVVYHCLRFAGVPRTQLGMNVKQFVRKPITKLFKKRAKLKHPDYQRGFEAIPDVVVFKPRIAGDWRRRNCDNTLRFPLLIVEIKASERFESRLTAGEIIKDIEKIAAHREEVLHLGGHFLPVMMVIDTAPETGERMVEGSRGAVARAAREHGVSLFYMSRSHAIASVGGPASASVHPRQDLSYGSSSSGRRRPGEGLALGVEQVAGVGGHADRQEVVDLGPATRRPTSRSRARPPALQVDEGLAAQMLDRDHAALELGTGRRPRADARAARRASPCSPASGRCAESAPRAGAVADIDGNACRRRPATVPSRKFILRRADEAGDEQVARACGRARAACRPARSRPAFSTTMRSASVIASTWSWVT